MPRMSLLHSIRLLLPLLLLPLKIFWLLMSLFHYYAVVVVSTSVVAVASVCARVFVCMHVRVVAPR